ncbi:hypothetical protein [Nonomuraea longispora]|uniref:hypothetical protein n=1 Tax=Nonomuraea longispora TaxID=1848320 RepID=UPI0014043E8C|nr:hypothetical protein [Nonomuraea longispora]
MTPSEIRAKLRALADHIDTELNDEHRDSQYVLERVLEDLTDLIADLPEEG